MATTVKSFTETQIRGLRSESVKAGDILMVVVCDVALDERADDISDYAWGRESQAERERVYKMTQDDAVSLVVDMITHVELEYES